MTSPRRPLTSSKMRIVVVGAGAFGGWTALSLLQRGADVMLVDAWGPGNARASSGGDTRVIRTTYGTRAVYTRLAHRAMPLWKAADDRRGGGLFRKTGVLWMFGRDDAFGRASMTVLQAEGIPMYEVPRRDARRRYPQIDFDGTSLVLFEPEAGYVFARLACEYIRDRFVAGGGMYRQAAVRSPVRIEGRLKRLTLNDGSLLDADAYVFACGPWLGLLFPDVIGRRVTATRQEVYYFGTPAGDERFVDSQLPVWIDVGKRVLYGIPGPNGAGFKVADDTSGPPFDPSSGERHVTPAGVRAARVYLRRRFPALRNAPLVDSEVCQYEATPDSHLIIDVHPRASNVWIAGGGSGHGFKMAPVVGEMVADLALGRAEPAAEFRLGRFSAERRRGLRLQSWRDKWS